MRYNKIKKNKFKALIKEYRVIQNDFFKEFEVDDIFSNSKIYEILIANCLGHKMIPGHSGSKDAKDKSGNEYEYKHYKKTSSNHTWTFNDFSDTTISNLNKCHQVIFAHVDNTQSPPVFDWCYKVPGHVMSKFLKKATKEITNTRKMINISKRNIEDVMGIEKTFITKSNNGIYDKWINNIYNICDKMEQCSNVTQLLTSNKIWEVLVAVELDHNVNAEQGGRAGAHDAFDKEGNVYEYKVSKSNSWNFQDISDNVLNKYLVDNRIILAVVNKKNIAVESIYSAKPDIVVRLLKEKLKEKQIRFKSKGKTIRRLQVSLSKSDLERIKAKKIF